MIPIVSVLLSSSFPLGPAPSPETSMSHIALPPIFPSDQSVYSDNGQGETISPSVASTQNQEIDLEELYLSESIALRSCISENYRAE